MIDRASIRKLFLKYKRYYINLLGPGPLDDKQLRDNCIYLNGVYTQDKLPLNKPGLYIINTSLSNQDGMHWVSIKLTKTYIAIFDTFSRKPDRLLSVLMDKVAKHGLKVRINNPHTLEQWGGKDSNTCGNCCLSYCRIIHEQGVKAALTI